MIKETKVPAATLYKFLRDSEDRDDWGMPPKGVESWAAGGDDVASQIISLHKIIEKFVKEKDKRKWAAEFNAAKEELIKSYKIMTGLCYVEPYVPRFFMPPTLGTPTSDDSPQDCLATSHDEEDNYYYLRRGRSR